MTAWNDFNDAEQQQSFELIPKGTVAKSVFKVSVL